MRAEELAPHTGNRFDSPLGEYGVRYFATKLEGCFGETLARFRPDLAIAAEFNEDGYMPLGEVPADWRQRRLAARVTIRQAGSRRTAQFLDVEHLATRETLRVEMAELLLALGHVDLDLATIRGPDRRLTRFISDWAYWATDDDGHYRFAGVRYTSRLDDGWECWAVFADDAIEIDEQAVHPISADDPDLLRVANQYGLRVW